MIQQANTSRTIFIQDWCDMKGKTQGDVAEKAKITRGQLSRINTGKSKGRPTSLRRIAKSLGLTSVEELYKSPFDK